MSKIIAIRSLQCPDHAEHLPPRVLTVMWFLGKRCNYDCSYCSPHIHDAVSPFVDLERAMRFIDDCDEYCRANDRQIKWLFTGGEPFIDPGFMPLIKRIKASAYVEQINVTTNGSLPLSVYQLASKYLDGITFSLHLERAPAEIDATIDTMYHLHRYGAVFVSANLMFLPGKLDRVRSIMSELQSSGLSYIVRKITPPESVQDLSPFERVGSSRKDRELTDLDQQSQRRQTWKMLNMERREQNIVGYYNQAELEFLAEANQRPLWQNMAYWDDADGYHEVNADQIMARDQNNFRDWLCFAGTDMIFVGFDGLIYRGNCQDGGSIGAIGQGAAFQPGPWRCQQEWCVCNADVAVRKCRSLEFLELIDHA